MPNPILYRKLFGRSRQVYEQFEYAVQFDTNEYFLQNTTDWKFSDHSDFTIFAAIYIDAYVTANTIITQRDVGDDAFQFLACDAGLSHKPVIRWYPDGVTPNTIFFDALPTTAWLYLVAYHDKGDFNNTTLHSNGTLLAADRSLASTDGIDNTTSRLMMGTDNAGNMSNMSVASVIVFSGDKRDELNNFYAANGLTYPKTVVDANTPIFEFMAKDQASDLSTGGIFRNGQDGGTWTNMDAGDRISLNF